MAISGAVWVAAGEASFTQLVLDGGWAVETSPQIGFSFESNRYPVPTNKLYRGKFKFSKHYYPVPADLEDGGEEWRCALAIDEHAQVKRWVRNLDSDPVAGFWLPTSSGRFYPDFVCELTDGRILVVEYKGRICRVCRRKSRKPKSVGSGLQTVVDVLALHGCSRPSKAGVSRSNWMMR